MHCPICQGNNLTVKNGNYFCNHCNMYIGKAKQNALNPLPESFLPNAAIKKQGSQIEKKDEKIVDFNGMFLTYIPSVVILGILFLISFFITSYPSYITFFPYCKIKVEAKNTTRFNSTVGQAIDKLKDEDTKTYNDLCNSVRKIKEEECYVFGGPLDGAGPGVKLSYVEEGGCFVKGSRVIYISSLAFSSTDEVNTTKEIIKRNASFAKEYWNNR